MQLVDKRRNSSPIEITTSGEKKSVSHLAMAKRNKSPKEYFDQAAREGYLCLLILQKTWLS